MRLGLRLQVLVVLWLSVVSFAAEECVTLSEKMSRQRNGQCHKCSEGQVRLCLRTKLECCGSVNAVSPVPSTSVQTAPVQTATASPHSAAANPLLTGECLSLTEALPRRAKGECLGCSSLQVTICKSKGLECCKSPSSAPVLPESPPTASISPVHTPVLPESPSTLAATQSLSLGQSQVLPQSPPTATPQPSLPVHWSSLPDPESTEEFPMVCLDTAQKAVIFTLKLYKGTMCEEEQHAACEAQGKDCFMASNKLFQPLGPCHDTKVAIPNCEPCEPSVASQCGNQQCCTEQSVPQDAKELPPPVSPVSAAVVDSEDDEKLTNSMRRLNWDYFTVDQLEQVNQNKPHDFVVFSQHGDRCTNSRLPMAELYPEALHRDGATVRNAFGQDRRIASRFLLPSPEDWAFPAKPGRVAKTVEYVMNWAEVFKALRGTRFVILNVCNGGGTVTGTRVWPDLSVLLEGSEQYVLYSPPGHRSLENNIYKCLWFRPVVAAVLKCFYRAGVVLETTAAFIKRTGAPDLIKTRRQSTGRLPKNPAPLVKDDASPVLSRVRSERRLSGPEAAALAPLRPRQASPQETVRQT